MKYREIASPKSEQPRLDEIPPYHKFFFQPELYERIHVHLIGVRPKDGGSATTSGGIGARRNRLGFKRVVDDMADPYATVETVGDDTGSEDYFPIGSHKFATLTNCKMPLWDAKCLLIAKKGAECTSGVKFAMFDENLRSDCILLEFTLDRSDFPESGAGWQEFVEVADSPEESERFADLEFVFRVRISDCAERVVSKEELDAFCDDTDAVSYTEVVIEGEIELDNALLQCWHHNETASKAVLWVIGRNDCFMHPHVAGPLFLDNGYDLYVLNYSADGATRKRGWVENAHLNSHNRHGTFDVYNNEIDKALAIMDSHNEAYDQVVGYAHSTGGPVLLNYLIEHGDTAFDSFIFNSPFLDWGWVGGDMVEILLENVGFLEKLSALGVATKLGTALTPDALKDTIIQYLDEEIVLCSWSAKLWSLYYFDWRSRPLYKVPMTGGFAKGVTAVHRKIENMNKQNKYITSKPFLCITSRGDDVLKSDETISRCDWIGPARCEIELRHNSHDVFLTPDESDSVMAIEMTVSWMKGHGFA